MWLNLKFFVRSTVEVPPTENRQISKLFHLIYYVSPPSHHWPHHCENIEFLFKSQKVTLWTINENICFSFSFFLISNVLWRRNDESKFITDSYINFFAREENLKNYRNISSEMTWWSQNAERVGSFLVFNFSFHSLIWKNDISIHLDNV